MSTAPLQHSIKNEIISGELSDNNVTNILDNTIHGFVAGDSFRIERLYITSESSTSQPITVFKGSDVFIQDFISRDSPHDVIKNSITFPADAELAIQKNGTKKVRYTVTYSIISN